MNRVTASKKRTPDRLRGALPVLGHLRRLQRDPIALLRDVADRCGELGEFRIGPKRVVLMSGPEAQEAFFRAPEEQLDQAAAYPFMTPIFGKGVVFDAPPERRAEMLHNHALRDSYMRGHAETIAAEVEAMVEGWGDEGEFDLLDFFSELTIYTSSACLIGTRFRDDLTAEFARLYHALEKGTDPIAYVNPYLPLPAFRRRDRARARLVELVQEIMDRRRNEAPADDGDLLDVMMSLTRDDGSDRFDADEITGMFISMMFAGHHTTSGTAAWTLIELLQHAGDSERVVAELDGLYADNRSASYQALREIPLLEGAIKEALRLHPPLILLMRVVTENLEYGEWSVEAGKIVAASPAISNRNPETFPNPDVFDPGRYGDPRHEDRQLFAWIPFGAGRHRCVGAAFALMQLKAILFKLLTEYEFELAQAAGTYRNDHSKMVVQLEQPCRVRYRRRPVAGSEDRGRPASVASTVTVAPRGALRVEVDRDLCQGHAVCCSEAPGVFRLGDDRKVAPTTHDPDPALIDEVRAAVRHCPTGALKLTETAARPPGRAPSEEGDD